MVWTNKQKPVLFLLGKTLNSPYQAKWSSQIANKLRHRTQVAYPI